MHLSMGVWEARFLLRGPGRRRGVGMGERSSQAHPKSAHQCLTLSADSWPYHSIEEMGNPGQRRPASARCWARGLNCEQRLKRGQCEHSACCCFRRGPNRIDLRWVIGMAHISIVGLLSLTTIPNA